MVDSPEKWPWSSYREMIGEARAPKWLALDALLRLFGERRKDARLNFKRCVREGLEAGESLSVWEGLRQQIFPGDEQFVERMQHLAQIRGDALTVLQAKRRPPAPSFEDIVAHHVERNAAMVAAYATGAYSYREIATHFGVHLATVGRVVRAAMQRSEN